VVIAALLAPGLESLATGMAHGCTAHVCQCRTPAPDAPAHREAGAAKPCHEASSMRPAVPLPDCAIRGTCRHDAPQLASASPFLLAAPLVPFTLQAEDRSRPELPGAPLVGFDRIDPRPPRAA
jgi:hypothetical protein